MEGKLFGKMAATRCLGVWIKYRHILPQIFMSKEYIGSPMCQALALSQLKTEANLKRGRLFYSWAKTLFYGWPHELSSANLNCQKSNNEKVRHCPQNSSKKSYQSSASGPPNRSGKERPLKLMDFTELVLPHPLKTFKNLFFSFLIRAYYDNSFTRAAFLLGAKQAVTRLSNLVSQGDFDSMEGLATKEAIRECSRSYTLLSDRQRKFLAVQPKDFFYSFIYEIGMIFDDQTDQRFVEITAVFQGVHGHAEMEKNPSEYLDKLGDAELKMYVCNYRFIREFTKGVEDDWIVNKLNHFSPKELVQNTNLFRR